MNRIRFAEIEKMYKIYYGTIIGRSQLRKTTVEVLIENLEISTDEITDFANELGKRGYKNIARLIHSQIDEILGQSKLDFPREGAPTWQHPQQP
jgi:hypothetical protein